MDNSMDSRSWGAVPRDYLQGKALTSYWSFQTPAYQYLKTGIPDRVKRFQDICTHFFSKTRWERILKPVQ